MSIEGGVSDSFVPADVFAFADDDEEIRVGWKEMEEKKAARAKRKEFVWDGPTAVYKDSFWFLRSDADRCTNLKEFESDNDYNARKQTCLLDYHFATGNYAEYIKVGENLLDQMNAQQQAEDGDAPDGMEAPLNEEISRSKLVEDLIRAHLKLGTRASFIRGLELFVETIEPSTLQPRPRYRVPASFLSAPLLVAVAKGLAHYYPSAAAWAAALCIRSLQFGPLLWDTLIFLATIPKLPMAYRESIATRAEHIRYVHFCQPWDAAKLGAGSDQVLFEERNDRDDLIEFKSAGTAGAVQLMERVKNTEPIDAAQYLGVSSASLHEMISSRHDGLQEGIDADSLGALPSLLVRLEDGNTLLSSKPARRKLLPSNPPDSSDVGLPASQEQSTSATANRAMNASPLWREVVAYLDNMLEPSSGLDDVDSDGRRGLDAHRL